MSKRRMDRDERLERQYQRLGTRKAICVGCGEEDPFCMEKHHLAGRKRHDDVSIICRNCHRKLTNQQLDHVPLMAEEPNGNRAVIGHYLLGFSDLLAMIAPTLRDFGEQLLDESDGDDD